MIVNKEVELIDQNKEQISLERFEESTSELAPPRYPQRQHRPPTDLHDYKVGTDNDPDDDSE